MSDHNTTYRMLAYPVAHAGHAADIATLRRVLNDHGYDAAPGDIERAFADWSEGEYAAGWVGVGGMSEGELFDVLWERLEHAGGQPADDGPRETLP